MPACTWGVTTHYLFRQMTQLLVLIVQERWQYPTYKFLWAFELPWDIQCRYSLKSKISNDNETQPSNLYISTINDEIWEWELMQIENEWHQTKSESRNPEVNEMRDPHRNRHAEQHNQRSHTQVDTLASKKWVENAELGTCSRESATCCDITGTTESRVAQDWVIVDLSGEHSKHGWKWAASVPKICSFPAATSPKIRECLRDRCRQGLRKGNTTFRFATRWEKFTLEPTVALRDEERQCTKSPTSTLSIRSNLMAMDNKCSRYIEITVVFQIWEIRTLGLYLTSISTVVSNLE